jgi:NADH-quinone oxidoreductase subunit L
VAGLTAFYSFRIIYLAFAGTFRGTQEQADHLHESPTSMTVPLLLLAVGAFAAGWIGIAPVFGGGNWIAHFFEPIMGHPQVQGSHAEEWLVVALSILAAVIGIVVSTIFYYLKPELPAQLAKKFKRVYTTLWNKYYVDELYDRIIVRPTYWIATNLLVAVTDAKIIEGVVNGVPKLIGNLGGKLRLMQTGRLQHYAVSMALGLFVILALVLIAGKR